MNDQKIIIFDGPDGTGKTNMAYALSCELSIPYFRMPTQYKNWENNKFKEALEFDQTYIVEYLKQTKQSVIIDRAYPSEWVYSKMYKRETNEIVLSEVDFAFSKLNTHIIIPQRGSYNDVKDDLINTRDLKTIHYLYNDFTFWTKCNTIRINVDMFYNRLDLEIPALLNNISFDRPLSCCHKVLGFSEYL